MRSAVIAMATCDGVSPSVRPSVTFAYRVARQSRHLTPNMNVYSIPSSQAENVYVRPYESEEKEKAATIDA